MPELVDLFGVETPEGEEARINRYFSASPDARAMMRIFYQSQTGEKLRSAAAAFERECLIELVTEASSNMQDSGVSAEN